MIKPEYAFATPMMQQYKKLKEEYADCILLFRLGDFYEMFMEDAYTGADVLNITLTSRDRGKDGRIPMAGIPYHALDSYLSKLVNAGYKVAIGEQVGDITKGELVERGVVRIVTPGTILDEKSLEKKENNYILGLQVEKDFFGIAIADISTGNFYTEEYNISELDNIILNELVKYNPKECILSTETYKDSRLLKLLNTHKNLNIYSHGEWEFYIRKAEDTIKDHFSIKSLNTYNIENKKAAVRASAGLLGYLKYTQKGNISHIKNIALIDNKEYVGLDRATITNLEIFSTIKEGNKKGSLINFLDRTLTPMGGRLLKEWIIKPLRNRNHIENRYTCVEKYSKDIKLKTNTISLLKEVGDIERLLSKTSLNMGNPKDIINLKNSLKNSIEVHKTNVVIKELEIDNLKNNLQKLITKVESVIIEETPLDPKNGNFIKTGNNKELDELKDISLNSKKHIARIEKEEKEKTGIGSLKIKYNQVFGYYIEITKTNLDQVPEYYMRKQTLVNAERFITPELKKHEEIIISAEEKTRQMEYEIFLELCEEIKRETDEIQSISRTIAKIDCLINFSEIAINEKYIRPTIIENGDIRIIKNRHPVVEMLLPNKEFVPNDVYLNNKEHQLIIITGPNMAGKSVYIRQVAITMLLAQTGCFVPAEKAEITLVDNIFVRSGASDMITSGLSTFMVEMVETANILNNATNESLIIMDEIGRGTSTYDGISIAWAIAEYLITRKGIYPKTLFATHYHELQKLEDMYKNKIKNYHFPATEDNGEPIFLHLIQSGASNHSFGIQVAKIAGVPKEVYENAKKILKSLENEKSKDTKDTKRIGTTTSQEIDEIKNLVGKINISNTTPLAALNYLAEIKKLLEN